MSVRARPLLLVCIVALGAVLLVLVGPRSPTQLRDLVDRAGPAAPLVLLGAWLVLVPALCSGPVLAGASDLILGTVAGAGVALLGATLGAAISFLLARGAGRDVAHRLAGARVAAVDRALVRRPVLGIAAVRAAPGMPASVLAYAAGLTRVRLRHFTCGMAGRCPAHPRLHGARRQPHEPRLARRHRRAGDARRAHDHRGGGRHVAVASLAAGCGLTDASRERRT